METRVGNYGNPCWQLWKPVLAVMETRDQSWKPVISYGSPCCRLLHRWWGRLGIAMQKSVGHMVLEEWSTLRLEAPCPLDELAVL
eukprot:2047124-Pyramimonas_sp.AAC.1